MDMKQMNNNKQSINGHERNFYFITGFIFGMCTITGIILAINYLLKQWVTINKVAWSGYLKTNNMETIGYFIFGVLLVGGIIYQTINYRDTNHD